MSEHIRDIVVNRKARHDYHLHDRFEAGLSLLGSEVKSLRGGRASLQEAYVRLDDRGAWLVGCHISPYDHANRNNHDPVRDRKLLLHRSELAKLRRATQQKGMTIVPVRLFFKGQWAKVEIALAKGKRLHDKRQTLKERTHKREMERG